MRGQAPLPKTWSYDEYSEAEKTFCRTVSEADGKVNIRGKFMKESSLRMGHCYMFQRLLKYILFLSITKDETFLDCSLPLAPS